MIETEPRLLHAREQAVLTAIYAALPAAQREALETHVDNLVVTATWGMRSASVEIRPAEGVEVTPAGIDDGILPARAIAYDGDDAIGEVIVWITDGIPSGIEYAYYLGDTPSELPHPDKIRLARSRRASESSILPT